MFILLETPIKNALRTPYSKLPGGKTTQTYIESLRSQADQTLSISAIWTDLSHAIEDYHNPDLSRPSLSSREIALVAVPKTMTAQSVPAAVIFDSQLPPLFSEQSRIDQDSRALSAARSESQAVRIPSDRQAVLATLTPDRQAELATKLQELDSKKPKRPNLFFDNSGYISHMHARIFNFHSWDEFITVQGKFASDWGKGTLKQLENIYNWLYVIYEAMFPDSKSHSWGKIIFGCFILGLASCLVIPIQFAKIGIRTSVLYVFYPIFILWPFYIISAIVGTICLLISKCRRKKKADPSVTSQSGKSASGSNYTGTIADLSGIPASKAHSATPVRDMIWAKMRTLPPEIAAAYKAKLIATFIEVNNPPRTDDRSVWITILRESEKDTVKGTLRRILDELSPSAALATHSLSSPAVESPSLEELDADRKRRDDLQARFEAFKAKSGSAADLPTFVSEDITYISPTSGPSPESLGRSSDSLSDEAIRDQTFQALVRECQDKGHEVRFVQDPVPTPSLAKGSPILHLL